MFNLDQAIAEWRQRMFVAGIKDTEALDELETHLRDYVEEQLQLGTSTQEAFDSVVGQIGLVQALKSEFDKVGGKKRTLLKKLKSILLGQAESFTGSSDFAPSAIQSLRFARAEAPLFHHDYVGTEHVLLGLLKLEAGILANVLRTFGVDRQVIRIEIEKVIGVGLVREVTAAIPYTPRVKKALQLAAGEAKALKQAEVGAEHIFLGLLREGGGVAFRVLKKLGVEVDRARDEIVKELHSRGGS